MTRQDCTLYLTGAVCARSVLVERRLFGARLGSDQLFLDFFLNYPKPLFSAPRSLAPEFNLGLQLMHSIFGRSEFHRKLVCQGHGAIAI
jgi:hypothetical protein